MSLANVVDADWMAGVLAPRAAAVGLPSAVHSARLIDARFSHPHRLESSLARAWATYAVSVDDGGTELLYVKAYPTGVSQAAWQAFRAASPTSGARHLPDVELIVWRFPDDPTLPALPGLVGPSSGQPWPQAVAAVLSPQRPRGAEDLRSVLVRYQPEASAVVRVEAAGPASPPTAVFAKHLAGTDVLAAHERHAALWSVARSTPSLRLAEPLAADVERSVLWTREVPGRPLVAALQPGLLSRLAEQLADTLVALHCSDVGVTAEVSVDELLGEAARKAAKLSRAHPPIAAAVTALVERASACRARVRSARPVTLHGDCHVDQVIASPDGLVLVDLDSLVRGAPEVDLAELIVDLAMRDLREDVVRQLSRLLLKAYETRATHALDPALLRICTDAEFVNRCYRHLRRRTPGWAEALEDALGRHTYVASLLQP